MRTLMITAAAILAAAPVNAQHGQHGQGGQQQPPPQQQSRTQQTSMMADHMQRCMDMMTGTSPGMLLQHRQDLSLTDDQVRRLETIRSRTDQAAMTHMRPAMDAVAAAETQLNSNAPNFQAYETRLRQAADHMVQAHVALARGAVEARQVLTSDQRSRIATLRTAGHEMAGNSNGGMHPGSGMQQGMMMPCMTPGPGQTGGGHGH